MEDRRPTSRWQRSATTYGPVGRLLATLLLLLPILYAIFVNLFFVVAAALWVFFLVPALRDVWKSVRYGEAPAQLVIPPDPAELAARESILDRRPPGRW